MENLKKSWGLSGGLETVGSEYGLGDVSAASRNKGLLISSGFGIELNCEKE